MQSQLQKHHGKRRTLLYDLKQCTCPSVVVCADAVMAAGSTVLGDVCPVRVFDSTHV